MSKTMSKSMTRGKPLKLIMSFALPLLVGNMFQQLYNMADTFIVGRTIGTNALAAVGSTGSITFLILGFIGGVTTGMCIVTSQRYGANDYDGTRKSLAVGIVISAVVSVVFTAISVPLTRPILQWMNTPADIIDDAYAYLIVIFAGSLATMMYNVLANFLRAVGDSRTPLYFLIIACVLNIVLDYTLILLLGMGVAGAAWATILAQFASGMLCLWHVMKKGSPFRLRREDWKMAWQDIRAHLATGLPMGFQTSIIAIGTILLQYAVNSLGTDSVAAFTAAGKIDNILVMPMMSLGMAMATYAAQNYGAHDIARVRQGVRQCAIVAFVYSVAAGLVNAFFGRGLVRFFVAASDEVVELAYTYLIIMGVTYFALALLFVYRYTLQGIGSSAVPTVAGVIELIMRSFAAVALSTSFGFVGACLASPLAWVGAMVPLMVSYYVIIRRKAREMEPQGCDGACACAGTEG